ncbi:CE1759 family FMN reductase [Arcanobacterium bovis]|uniref:Flavoprotein n=1 Tax=Arcanobacterium bovis TaxID=2529275 RepID=A0A4Q9V3X4_9ACTO|nr:CE1759 family FMN reductase [Arcanobacterium bovis]TBW23687.1 flavoprotein [Arcanobacterium bovis]
MKIVAVWTGLSEESATTRLAERMIKSATERFTAAGKDVQVTRINVREIAASLTKMTLAPAPYPDVEAAFAAVKEADAVITVTPIYKAAPVALHTLFWQLIDDAALAGTPVAIGATGGTARHSLAVDTTLRPILSYLKASVTPTSIFAATADWGSTDSNRRLAARIESVIDELLPNMARVSRQERQAERIADEYDPDGVVPFAQLLAQ